MLMSVKASIVDGDMLPHCVILPCLKRHRINQNSGLRYFAGEPPTSHIWAPRATEEQKAKVKIVNTLAAETMTDGPYLRHLTFDGTHDSPCFCIF